MKEEDLIKKLENVELPDIKLQGHQRRLKMALLDSGYSRRQQKNTILELAKSIVKGVKDTMIKGLVSRQPVWKTATIGILAVALVLGLSLTIPSLTTDSVYAQAEEIVRNSPEVHKALDDAGEIKVINIDIEDYEGIVIAQGEAGTISAKVDLRTNSVTDVATFVIDEQKAIEIAKADPGVKELLDSGATIGEVSTLYVCGEMGNVETGETEKFSETYVMVEIRNSGDLYIAHINLSEGKVIRLSKESFDPASMEPPTEEFFFITDPGAPDFASGEEGQ